MTVRQNRTRWGWTGCMAVLAGMTAAGIVSGVRVEKARAEDSREAVAASRSAQTEADGRPIFDRACGRCHPHGEQDIGPRITNKNFDEARIVKQIRQGVGRMRAISATKLPEERMPALLAYLRSIHTVR